MKIRHLMTLRMVSYILACICEGVRMYILAPYTSVHALRSILAPYTSVHALRAILTPYTSVHALADCENTRFHTKILASYILSLYTSVKDVRKSVGCVGCQTGMCRMSESLLYSTTWCYMCIAVYSHTLHSIHLCMRCELLGMSALAG